MIRAFMSRSLNTMQQLSTLSNRNSSMTGQKTHLSTGYISKNNEKRNFAYRIRQDEKKLSFFNAHTKTEKNDANTIQSATPHTVIIMEDHLNFCRQNTSSRSL